MLRKSGVLFIALSWAICGVAWASEISNISVLSDPVPIADIMTCRFDLSMDYENPYDPDQVDAKAIITEPDGNTVEAIAFYFTPFSRSLDAGNELLTPTGEASHWRVRFAPRKEGEHEFFIRVTDSGGTTESATSGFTAVSAGSRGFVRAPESRYLRFDDGSYYVPIGYNIDWCDMSGSYFFDEYYEEMAGAGGNWSRLWMTHFNGGITIEWGAYHPSGLYQGLGRYSQGHAFRLDTILQKAQDLGLYIQIVLNQHSQFETGQWSSWADNPYNTANGGPCETSADYFSNEEANRLYDRRIRYMVARYAAYRSVMAWELWNELELLKGYLPWVADPWQHEKRDLIRTLDPQDHPITTSYGNPVYLFYQDLDGFDINQRHMYMGASDWTSWFDHAWFLNSGKPLILGEFGIGIYGDLNEKDPTGIHMHAGIWSTMLAGYAGGGMLWWWDNYIHPNGLAHILTAPAAFMADEDMGQFTTEFLADASCDQDGYLWANGIRSDDRVLLWVHDPQNGWWSAAEPPRDLTNIRVTLPTGPGSYDLELWDTWTGETTPFQTVLSDPPVVEIGAMTGDLALKAQRLSDDDTTDDDSVDDDTTVDDDTADDDDTTDDDTIDDDTSDDDITDDDSIDDDFGDDSIGDNPTYPELSSNYEDESGCGC